MPVCMVLSLGEATGVYKGMCQYLRAYAQGLQAAGQSAIKQ